VWLLAVPPEERQGPVFRLPSLQGGQPITPNRVGKIVEKISKKAGVKVGTRTKRDRKTGKVIEVPTTESYYVHLNAADVSDELWEKYGPGASNNSGQLQQSSNTPPAKSTAP
jgi:hypothetical protein